MIQTSISSKQHIYILYYSVSFLFTQAEESSPHSVTLGEDTCFLLQFFWCQYMSFTLRFLPSNALVNITNYN